jgi:hypothetical protein
MDFNNLRDQVSNLTLYDIKAGVRKVQNGSSSELAEQFSDCNANTFQRS